MNSKFEKKKALVKQKEYKKFLDGFKKKPPKNLDYVVQETHDEVFEKIDCMDCGNCCRTTGPMYTDKDIERISKHLKMKSADFEAQFLRVDEDKDIVLKELPCYFLNEDNSCSIYDVRPKACREYPHTDRKKIFQITDIMIKNTEVCPAALDFVEKLMVKINK